MTVVELGLGVEALPPRLGDGPRARRRVGRRSDAGELVGLVGPSGSGKTTLLNLVCGWETPDAGEIRRADRARTTGPSSPSCPQALGLVEELTVRENASLPLRFPTPREPADVDDVLDRLGLTDLAHRPSTGTSLGEQQRTAIARALVARPHLLVADEPTAHQNAAWARALLGEMRTVCTDGGAVLVATHDRELLSSMDRIVTLHDGRVVN